MDIWPWSAWLTVTPLLKSSGTRMRPNCRYWTKAFKTGFLGKKPPAVNHTLSLFPALLLIHQLGGRIQRLAGGQYLEIQEVRPEDSGHYSCVVTNIAGSNSLFFTVEIICKSACLKWWYFSTISNSFTNNILSLWLSSATSDKRGQHCGNSSYQPGSSLTLWIWRRYIGYCYLEKRWLPSYSGHQKVGSNTSRRSLIVITKTQAHLFILYLCICSRYTMLPEGSLHVHRVQLSDAGRYFCTVSNQAGSDHRGVDLRVFGDYQ